MITVESLDVAAPLGYPLGNCFDQNKVNLSGSRRSERLRRRLHVRLPSAAHAIRQGLQDDRRVGGQPFSFAISSFAKLECHIFKDSSASTRCRTSKLCVMTTERFLLYAQPYANDGKELSGSSVAVVHNNQVGPQFCNIINITTVHSSNMFSEISVVSLSAYHLALCSMKN